MPITTSPPRSILIAGITPYFLERGVLWFQEHHGEIQKKSRRDAWWGEHTLFLEAGARMALSALIRKLAEMGYVKVGQVAGRGEFAARGGIIDISPINRAEPIRAEFSGNVIERLIILPQALAQKKKKAAPPKDPTEYERLWLSGLREGDFMVHVDHGIGLFRGFIKNGEVTDYKSQITNGPKIQPSSPEPQVEGNSKFKMDLEFARQPGLRPGEVEPGAWDLEFYVLEYAPARRGGMPDRLLVPRAQSPKLSRYIGFETPAIHRLGATAWESTQRRAREDTRKFAEELMGLYRNRAAASRPPYPEHAEVERHLAHSFLYEETEDQKRAIADVRRDLSGERPMDRLLLGDVGFGKTEVALRAAARAAMSGRQIAVLAPTTILADQHYGTFCERLQGLPFEVAMLTRLTPKRDIRGIIHRIASGKIDITIGTHRLLSRDLHWRDLGLAIIDEEQRFGVRHKEHFKKFRAGVDVLSLSATPIPRTLSLALAKFRDVSLIREAPRGRMPVKTFVLPFSRRIIAEAITEERKRGGQIFYLWNRIENIDVVRRDIERLARGARIASLHGRMPEKSLIRVMHEFRSGAIDILLATTIIENGLDLPSVNTLIVADAARLGLAQAYQIRGRVGRGDQPAYAYFLYPIRGRAPKASAIPPKAKQASGGVRPARGLSEKAALRLEALKEAEALGSGFQVALRDLEIRGAGNVLGRQQSGTMNRVGLNLYAQLLGEALEGLKP